MHMDVGTALEVLVMVLVIIGDAVADVVRAYFPARRPRQATVWKRNGQDRAGPVVSR